MTHFQPDKASHGDLNLSELQFVLATLQAAIQVNGTSIPVPFYARAVAALASVSNSSD